MTDKNIILGIPNATLNAGAMTILRYTSLAVKRFEGKWKHRSTFYSKKMEITFNQWQEEMAKYKAPKQGDIGMTHADLGRGRTEEQLISLTEHGCASDVIIEQQFKQAMGSPERMAEFVVDRMEIVGSRAQYEIDKKFFNDICNLDNYREKQGAETNSPAIFLNEEKEYKLSSDKNGVTSTRKLFASVKSTTSVMKRPTDRFNKLKLFSSSLNLKRIGIIVSDEMVGNMEDHYGNTFNLEYAKLENRFAWVESAPIHEIPDPKGGDKGKHIIAIGEDGYVCEIDDDSPTDWDTSRKAFQETWFYKWVYAFQDVAWGRNLVCWGVQA